MLTPLPQCVDITFVDPTDPRLAEVNETNCLNSSDIGFSSVYTITTKAVGASPNATSDAARSPASSSWRLAGWLPVVLGGLWVLL